MQQDKVSPLVSSVGFAIFLVINATQVWGGVFPFLPLDFQTPDVTLWFYLAQSIAFVAAIAVSVVGSYVYPEGARRMLVGVAVAMVAVGSFSIIAAMYSPAGTLALVLFGGAALGVGVAAFFMLWQRYFSSLSPEECNWQLMVGTILSAVFYYALYLIPVALTAFLIPLVFLPISALCLVLSVRGMSFDQPMFEDVPREHPEVYGHLLRDSWRSAVGLAAIGFACGLARGVALNDPSLGALTNIASMGGSLLAAAVLLGLSRVKSVRFDMNMVFRALFPLVITGYMLFPFFQSVGLNLFAGVAYLAFSAIMLVMMMQSAQTSRDRGTNPVFVYGFFAACAYAAQGAGFLLGWNAQWLDVMGADQVMLFSMVAAYVMGMGLFFVTRPLRGVGVQRTDHIELIRAQKPTGADGDAAEGSPQRPPRKRARADEADRSLKDRLSKQCLVAQDRYALSSRETEVMELIARGLTVSAISKQLFISENTVRTHSKHIYTKMDIHSKQELVQALESVDLARFDDAEHSVRDNLAME